MTFGYDQCRVCGIDIPPHKPEELAEVLKARKRPPIPEKEWRRRGYLAAPTRHQLKMPAGGCCQVCGEKQMLRHWSASKRVTMVFTISVMALVLLWTVITYSPYLGVVQHFSHPLKAN